MSLVWFICLSRWVSQVFILFGFMVPVVLELIVLEQQYFAGALFARKPFIILERETGFEAATSSLGSSVVIAITEDRVFANLDLTIRTR